MASLQELASAIGLNTALRQSRDRIRFPRDLPGRFGRAARAFEEILKTADERAAVIGGWAIWWNGFEGRINRHIDVANLGGGINRVLVAAADFGLVVEHMRCMNRIHMASGIDLRIHLDVQCETDPSEVLVFATMFDTIRTKMRAGRIKDSADIIEVIKSHPDEMDRVQNMLTENDVDLIYRFERLRWLASIPDP